VGEDGGAGFLVGTGPSSRVQEKIQEVSKDAGSGLLKAPLAAGVGELPTGFMVSLTAGVGELATGFVAWLTAGVGELPTGFVASLTAGVAELLIGPGSLGIGGSALAPAITIAANVGPKTRPGTTASILLACGRWWRPGTFGRRRRRP
jgi:hypothetical protein